MNASNINLYEHQGNWFFKVPGITNPVGPFMTKPYAEAAITEIPDSLKPGNGDVNEHYVISELQESFKNEPVQHFHSWEQDYHHGYVGNNKEHKQPNQK